MPSSSDSKSVKCKQKSVQRKDKINKAEPPFDLHNVNSSKNRSFEESFSAVVNLLRGRKNVLVLAGAGMSVSCGIPDFRSEDSGLYSTLNIEELGLSCPEDLFDWEIFQEDPRPFFKFAKSLYFPLGADREMEPSCSHRFLALLQQKGMLLRVYTQNMDGLETVAGVSPKKMVHAHGSLQWAKCCKCKRKVPASDMRGDILKGTVPVCQHAISPPTPTRPTTLLRTNNNTTNTRKRRHPGLMHGSQKSLFVCGGVLKPCVTFFGEPLHDNVRRSLEADREKADALIVIGTSLSVAPMSKVIEYLPPTIPRILINRTLVQPPQTRCNDEEENGEREFRENYVFDAHLLGFCDDVTRALVKKLNNDTTNDDTKNAKEGKLLVALEDDDEFYDVEEFQSEHIPPERVFLFPGALLGECGSDLTYKEVVHCDGCAGEIKGSIRQCIQCFDFDLCRSCFPKGSKTHFEGKHSFTIDRR